MRCKSTYSRHVFIYPNVANQDHFIFPILVGLGTNLFAEGKKRKRGSGKIAFLYHLPRINVSISGASQ